MEMPYLKLASLAAAVVVGLHVLEDSDFALALCFATFAAISLEILFRDGRFFAFLSWIEIEFEMNSSALTGLA
jgi:hypothetical protein